MPGSELSSESSGVAALTVAGDVIIVLSKLVHLGHGASQFRRQNREAIMMVLWRNALHEIIGP